MREVGTARPARSGPGRAGRAAALAAAALALAALPGRPTRAAGVQGQGEVRVGLMHLDYEERDAGAFLDGEKGFLPAIVGEVELRGEQLFGRAMVRLANGTVSYDGHVQSADPTFDGLPLQTDSGAFFAQGELQGGVLVGEARQVAIFGALGARRWSRDIRSATVTAPSGAAVLVSGYSEVYTWYELQLGARWTFLSRPGTTWDLDARLVRTASPEVSVDLSSFIGVSAQATLSLEARTGWRLGSTYRRDLSPLGTFLAVSAYLEGYAFGASAVDPVYGIFEPDSSTLNFGLEVGVGGRF